jgi:hypothetical protein
VNEIRIMESHHNNFMEIDRKRISSRINKLVFGAQFDFQRLMVVSVQILEVDFEL